MTSTIRKRVWPVLLVLLFACVAWAQGQGYGQGQQNPPKSPAPPNQPGQTAPAQPAQPEAPPVNKEEEDAYKTLFETRGDANRKIQLGEDFLKKFPQSRYRESVYSQLTSAYVSLGQEDKMLAAGEKALELNSNDVDVLALLAWVIPRRAGGNALDADQKLDKAEKYGKQAISLLATLQKPAALSDADFAKAKNEKLSMCHSGLGVVYFHRQKYADSAAELEQATKLAPNPDPTDFYILGMTYMNAKRFGDAAGAFGHCGEIGWSWQDRCKQELANAKKLAATQLSAPK
jgi:tetratricopeptide (TPR) repeat protein